MRFRIPLRSPEGSEGAGAAAPAAGTTAPATTETTTTVPPVTTEEPANPSKREWADFHKTQRELVKSMSAIADGLAKVQTGVRTETPKPAAPAANTAPADAGIAERIAGLERTAALKGVYADLGIKPGPQRDFIETATKGMAHEAIPAFVESYLKTLPAPATATASAAAITNPVSPPVATGAASAAAKPDPGDLASMDPEVLKSLPLEERRKRYEEYRSRGPNTNPYAGARSRQLIRTGGK